MRTIYYQYIRFAFVKISLAGSISGFEPANICTERTQVFSTVAIELKKINADACKDDLLI